MFKNKIKFTFKELGHIGVTGLKATGRLEKLESIQSQTGVFSFDLLTLRKIIKNKDL